MESKENIQQVFSRVKDYLVLAIKAPANAIQKASREENPVPIAVILLIQVLVIFLTVCIHLPVFNTSFGNLLASISLRAKVSIAVVITVICALNFISAVGGLYLFSRKSGSSLTVRNIFCMCGESTFLTTIFFAAAFAAGYAALELTAGFLIAGLMAWGAMVSEAAMHAVRGNANRRILCVVAVFAVSAVLTLLVSKVLVSAQLSSLFSSLLSTGLMGTG